MFDTSAQELVGCSDNMMKKPESMVADALGIVSHKITDVAHILSSGDRPVLGSSTLSSSDTSTSIPRKASSPEQISLPRADQDFASSTSDNQLYRTADTCTPPPFPQYREFTNQSLSGMSEQLPITNSIAEDIQNIVNSPTLPDFESPLTTKGSLSIVVCEQGTPTPMNTTIVSKPVLSSSFFPSTAGTAPSDSSASSSFKMPSISTYAEASNLALRHPEHAATILQYPLATRSRPVSPSSANPAVAPPEQGRDLNSSIHAPGRPSNASSHPICDGPEHTASRPNWQRASLPETSKISFDPGLPRRQGINQVLDGSHLKRRRQTKGIRSRDAGDWIGGKNTLSNTINATMHASESSSGITANTVYELSFHRRRGSLPKPYIPIPTASEYRGPLLPVAPDTTTLSVDARVLLNNNISKRELDQSTCRPLTPPGTYRDDSRPTLSDLFQNVLNIHTSAKVVKPLVDGTGLRSLETEYQDCPNNKQTNHSIPYVEPDPNEYTGRPYFWYQEASGTSEYHTGHTISSSADSSLLTSAIPAEKSAYAISRTAVMCHTPGATQEALSLPGFLHPRDVPRDEPPVGMPPTACQAGRDTSKLGISGQAEALVLPPHTLLEHLWGGGFHNVSIGDASLLGCHADKIHLPYKRLVASEGRFAGQVCAAREDAWAANGAQPKETIIRAGDHDRGFDTVLGKAQPAAGPYPLTKSSYGSTSWRSVASGNADGGDGVTSTKGVDGL